MTEEINNQLQHTESGKMDLERLAQKYQDNELAKNFIQFAQRVSETTQRMLPLATGVASAVTSAPIILQEAIKLPLPAQPLSGITLGLAADIGTGVAGGILGKVTGDRWANIFRAEAVRRIQTALPVKK